MKIIKNKVFKYTLLFMLLFIIIFLMLFVIKKIINNIHLSNIKSYDWLSKNVFIKKDQELGNNIYRVYKSSDINIYNSNYRKVIDEKYEDIKKNNYTFNNPLMIYNLYGTNLLSLNINFKTTEESYLEYKISISDEDITDFERTLNNGENNNLTKNHEYQIIGFVPGYENILYLTLKDKTKNIIDTKEIKIDFTNIKCNSQTTLEVNSKSSKELSNGLYTILGNDSDESDYVALYDNDGIIRGEIPIIGYRAHSILFKDDLMYFSISQTKIAAVDRLGKIQEVYKTGNYFLHHDYVFDDDGNLLVLANNQNKDTEEDCIIKINLQTKEITEVLDLEDIFESYVKTCKLDTKSVRDEGEDGLDWIHLNSIEYVDGDVILSSRETSSIIKIKDLETSPSLEYILADSKLWDQTDYKDYVYKKVGNFKIHAGQHFVRYFKGEEDGVYYLKFFDNNYGKQLSQPDFDYSLIGINNNNAFNGDNSNYYVYKIDENSKTFELVNSIAVSYSGIVSSAQTLDNDNILIDSGTKGIFTEYDSNYNVIKTFSIKMNKYMVYRVLKYNFNGIWFYE